MEYEVKNVAARGVPFIKTIDGQEVYGINLVITVGVVGQTYDGFVNTDINPDTFCPVEKTDTIEEIQDKMALFAEAYVEEKYPNT